MGRIYAKHATSYSWGGFMQSRFAEKVRTYSIYHGEVLCKRELLEGNPVINHVLHNVYT